MIFHATSIPGAMRIELDRRGDSRGYFARSFCTEEFAARGLETSFVQQNLSVSAVRGTLRGLHFQRDAAAEAKLIRVVRGAIYDVVLDLRPDSPTYGAWEAFDLNDANQSALYIPRGAAHGFLTLSDNVEVHYLLSNWYNPAAEAGIRWDDPAFAIRWPMAPTVMSDRDRAFPDFR